MQVMLQRPLQHKALRLPILFGHRDELGMQLGIDFRATLTVRGIGLVPTLDFSYAVRRKLKINLEVATEALGGSGGARDVPEQSHPTRCHHLQMRNRISRVMRVVAAAAALLLCCYISVLLFLRFEINRASRLFENLHAVKIRRFSRFGQTAPGAIRRLSVEHRSGRTCGLHPCLRSESVVFSTVIYR